MSPDQKKASVTRDAAPTTSGIYALVFTTDGLKACDSLPLEIQPRPLYGTSVGLHVQNRKDLIREIKKGLPFSSFNRLQEELEVSAKTLAVATQIPERTLTRRKQEGRLQTGESERLLRIGTLFDLAVFTFGNREHARQWFKTPKKAFGENSPLDYADTEPGAREVEDLLGRLAHGVFS